MAEQERLHRADPTRTGPIRDGTTYLRDSHSWRNGMKDREQFSSSRGGTAESLEDVVTQGVQLGYKVIEEYLREGQRVAEGMYNAASGPDDNGHRKGVGNGGGIESNVEELIERMRRSYDGLGGDMEHMMERTMHLYKDMWDLWMEGIEIFFRNPMFMSGGLRPETGPQSGTSRDTQWESEPDPPANGFGVIPVVEILSSRPTRVALKMDPQAGQFLPQVQALYAADPTIRPLKGVSFLLGPESAIPVVQVKIPDDQPPGTYTGAVVDRTTNEPKGTLCISILS